MRTGLLVTLVAIVVVAILAVYLATQPPTQPQPTTSPTTTSTPPATTSPTSPPTSPTTFPPTPSPSTTQSPSPTSTSTPPPTQPAPTCDKLVVLTRHPTDILDATRDLFLKSDVAKKYGIKDVVFRPLAAAQWRPLIERGEADAAWGGGPTLFDSLYKDGLLLPLEGDEVKAAIAQIPKTVAGMPMMRVGPDGKVYWVAWAISSFGITINTKVLRTAGVPEPKTWTDLASLEYGKAILKGMPVTGLAQLTKSTSNTRIAEIILQAYGWDQGWVVITLTAANGKVYGGSEAVRDAVIAGEIGAGWTIDFYGYTAQLQNPDTKYVIPPDTSVNGDPIAVVKNTKCRAAAEAFVAWVITEGQVVVFDPKINRMPVNPNAFNTPQGKQRPDLKSVYDQLFQLKTIEFNDTLALAVENVVMYYFDAAITDNIDILQQTWLKLVKALNDGKIDRTKAEALAQRLGEPVTFVDPDTGQSVKLTMEYAMRINDRIGTDSTYRDKVYAAWRDAARKKYQEVASQIP
ncbi:MULTISPECIES: ABC transporter substrate-binding protein [Pyrobaculum]|uniref:Extracellular solute-binding protein, family 1 n=2 Tax=Pyrobaculum arsenaticum TaxID=121277 RepID=A4WK22_PYRAR|nr:ABC transporter substrate-binding protein [Pyrobaculum arsenaticum]ABP50739.1 extracellular solute-binding protein, family 1 [Pyrobaculum arsenaticum DSM 13514]MCY0891256.1 ABC transporter substrate-binding protein [Pyrobaculum arsenaticum]NYR15544.1 ABC transporter substrate-binding protein [Pyrobaculum arsenaticum]